MTGVAEGWSNGFFWEGTQFGLAVFEEFFVFEQRQILFGQWGRKAGQEGDGRDIQTLAVE